jgi:hypothetical protein
MFLSVVSPFELNEKKQKQLKGWVIKIYCHFQSMTHSNIED